MEGGGLQTEGVTVDAQFLTVTRRLKGEGGIWKAEGVIAGRPFKVFKT